MGEATNAGRKLFRDKVKKVGSELAADGGRVAKLTAKGLYFMYGKVSLLGSRMEKLKGQVDAQEARLVKVEATATDVAETKVRATNARDSAKEAKDAVAQVKTEVAAEKGERVKLAGKVAELFEASSGMDTKLTAETTARESLGGKVEAVEGTVGTLTQKLGSLLNDAKALAKEVAETAVGRAMIELRQLSDELKQLAAKVKILEDKPAPAPVAAGPSEDDVKRLVATAVKNAVATAKGEIEQTVDGVKNTLTDMILESEEGVDKRLDEKVGKVNARVTSETKRLEEMVCELDSYVPKPVKPK